MVRNIIRNKLFEGEKIKSGAGFFIFDTDGKVLITHPAGDASGPNIWSIPKGGVNGDEDVLQCAYREVLEETSLDLKKIKGEVTKAGVSTYTSSYGPTKILNSFVFKAQEPIQGNYKIVCKSLYQGKPENDKNMWATREQAMKLLAPYQAEVLAKIKTNEKH